LTGLPLEGLFFFAVEEFQLLLSISALRDELLFLSMVAAINIIGG